VSREGLTRSGRQLLLSPAQRPEHTSVATDLKVVLRQACVSASKGLDFGPALPYTMGTVGSDSKTWDCASPHSGLLGAFLICLSAVTQCQYTILMTVLLFMCKCDLWMKRVTFALALAQAYGVDRVCLSGGH